MSYWKWFRSSVFLAAVVVAGRVHGQPVAVQPPPYYKLVPPDTQWVIKVSELKKIEGRPVFKEIRGTRSAVCRHEVVSWGDEETERWLVKHLLLESVRGQGEVVPTSYSRSPQTVEKRLSEFPELDWLKPDNQKGMAEVNGRQCRYYARTLVVKPEIDSGILEQVAKGEIEMPSDIIYEYKAWIDAATGWPVAYENQDYRYEYEFTVSETPLSLVLPERFLRAARMIDPKFAP